MATRPYTNIMRILSGFLLILFLGCSSIVQEKVTNSNEIAQNIESLSNVYKKYFSIGTAVSMGKIRNPKLKSIVKKHFSSITAENAMKPENLIRKNGTYDWREADEIVAFANENNMEIRGHTLVWHSQTPDWFFQDEEGNNLSRDKLYLKLYEYMSVVITHFDDIQVWDVVNEAVSNKNVSPNIYRQEKSKWFEICGQDFVERAFKMARLIAPDKKLFYNDFNLISPKKQDKAYKMLKNLLDKGVPIDGIGIQAHWHVDDTPEKVEKAIRRFASLGLEIHITELDVSFFRYHEKVETKSFEFTKNEEEKQAKAYASFFEIFRKYKNNITSVSLWGVSDKYSWLNNHPVKGRRNYPLLFDDNFNPKKSFYAIIENVK